MSWTRLVLRGEDGRSQLATLAARQRWYIDAIVDATDERPFELVYVARRHDARISYIEDGLLGLDLALARGPDHEQVAELIREKVSVVDRAFVLAAARAAKTGDDLLKAAYLAAGTATSDFDQELFDVIAQAAHSGDVDARHGALRAIAYVEWQECRALLSALSDDPDADVRQSASAMLAAYPPATRQP